MFITAITVEDLDQGPDAKEVPDPTWAVVETALRRMDGAQRSIVTLDAPDGGFMAVGGGENELYVCFVVDNNGAEVRLLGSPEALDVPIDVYMGQPNIRSNREAADLETIIAVTKVYAETGKLSSIHEWGDP